MKALFVYMSAVLFSGCIIISGYGDSNTQSTPDLTRWVKRLPPLIPNSAAIERALSGSTIVDWPAVPHGDCATTGWASEQLSCHLASDHPTKIILAYGTNDLIYFIGQGTFQDIVNGYQARVDYAASLGVTAYVALTPPTYCMGDCLGLYEPNVETLNAALIAHFGAGNVVDFWTNFPSSEFGSDGIHLNDAGQQHRAQVAADFINSH